MVSRTLEISSPGRFKLVNRPVPAPADNEVVVRVEVVSTCPQWDMHLWRGEPMFPGHPVQYPITNGWPGHEMVGRIQSVGRNVRRLFVGQRVAAWKDSGTGQGAYVTHYPIAADLVLPVPDDSPTHRWAALELATCVSSLMLDLQRHGFLPCRKFAVSGLGPAGLIAIQIARAQGVQAVIGLEPNPARRKQAERLGCDRTYDPQNSDLPPRKHADAIDVAIDCVGHANVVDFLAARTRDVLGLFGVQRQPYVFKPEYYCLPPLRLWGYPSTDLAAAQFAHGLVATEKLNLAALCTHTLPLGAYDKVVDLLITGEAVKVCVTCDDESV